MQKNCSRNCCFYKNAMNIKFNILKAVFMVALIFIAVLFKLFATKSDQDFNLCYKTK